MGPLEDNSKDEKPLCFGTYVGDGDILCSKCNEKLKKECIRRTSSSF